MLFGQAVNLNAISSVCLGDIKRRIRGGNKLDEVDESLRKLRNADTHRWLYSCGVNGEGE